MPGELLSSPDEVQGLPVLTAFEQHTRSEDGTLRSRLSEPGGNLIDSIRALGKPRIKGREESSKELARLAGPAARPRPSSRVICVSQEPRHRHRGRVSLEDLFEQPLSILNAAGKGIGFRRARARRSSRS